jgi:hypothetical protein
MQGAVLAGIGELERSVIGPTLRAVGIADEASCYLLSATAATETALEDPQAGRFGLYQISADDHQSLWDEYLVRDPELASAVRGFASQKQFLQEPHTELVTNLSYATVIAWHLYARHGEPLPQWDDPDAMSEYWWRLYRSRHDGLQDHSRHAFLRIYEAILGAGLDGRAA